MQCKYWNRINELFVLCYIKIHWLTLHFKWIFYSMMHWLSGASQVAQTWKNPPAMRETWVWSLTWEDLPKKGMAIHSSILPWRITVDRGAWQATVQRVAKSWRWLSNFHFTFFGHFRRYIKSLSSIHFPNIDTFY